MEFLRERVYTSLNADELKPGDKVITALTMADLKALVERNAEPSVIEVIQDETNTYRFTCNKRNKDVMNWRYDVPLAYLVERAETEHDCQSCKYKNCGFKDFNTKNECDEWEAKLKTDEKWCKNCGVDICSRAGVDANVRCPAWQPKAEKHTDYNHCEEARKAYDHAMTNACPNKHYRPFKDTDELVRIWGEKCKAPFVWEPSLELPLIWVRSKFNKDHKGCLITNFFGKYVLMNNQQCLLGRLFDEYTFLDGSACGVEE